MALEVTRDKLKDIKIYWFVFSFIPGASYLLQGSDGRALPTIVGVPVHVQNLFPIHRHDPRKNAFLPKTRLDTKIHQSTQTNNNNHTLNEEIKFSVGMLSEHWGLCWNLLGELQHDSDVKQQWSCRGADVYDEKTQT